MDRFGLIIDQYGKTNVENIYGAGDITGRNMTWSSAVRMGMIVAYEMSGILIQKEDLFHNKSSMTFFDIPSLSVGDFMNLGQNYEYEVQNNDASYRKLVYKDHELIGAIFQGDLTDSGIVCNKIFKRVEK